MVRDKLVPHACANIELVNAESYTNGELKEQLEAALNS